MRVRPLIVVTALAALTASLILAAPVGAASSGGLVTTSGGTGGAGGTADEPATGVDPVASAPRYTRLWDRVTPREKRWAHQTAECESGGNPKAIGGGGIYRGAFQFMLSTWKHSPKTPGGDPIAYPYRTQAVVAVALMRADGTGHWPVCG
jgi:transglycosylase-like protein